MPRLSLGMKSSLAMRDVRLPEPSTVATMHTLAPAQRKAVDALIGAAAPGHVITLSVAPGMGKTRMLRAAQERLGGPVLTAGEVRAATAGRHPLAIEDAFHELIDDALREATPLFIDDADLVARVV